MKKTIRYAAMILALGLAAACNKTEEGFSEDGLIRFAPESPATKAMIKDNAALQAATFQVYDILDGTEYINESITYGSGTWNYGSGKSYTWKNGTHKLFGYRTDGLTTSFDENNKVSFTHTLTTADAAQVDFLYSEVKTMTAAEWKATNPGKDTPVPLNFKHLFSALAITIQNYTGADVSINSVTVEMPNKAKAEVDYSGADPSVSIANLEADGNFASVTSAVTMAKDAKFDVLKNAVLSDNTANGTTYMVWPQTFEAGDVKVVVNYTQGETTKNSTVEFPAATWAAGTQYAYNLLIRPTEIVLNFNVQPWESVDNLDDIDTATGSINMSNVTWVNKKVTYGTGDSQTVKNTVDNSGYGTVYLLKKSDGTYEPAMGYFTVNYPTSGKYEISLIPAYGGTEADLAYFTVSPSGEQTLPVANGIPQTIYFTISANNPGTEKHVAAINISITPTGGEKVSAYSEIRANYTLTINNDPE